MPEGRTAYCSGKLRCCCSAASAFCTRDQVVGRRPEWPNPARATHLPASTCDSLVAWTRRRPNEIMHPCPPCDGGLNRSPQHFILEPIQEELESNESVVIPCSG